MLAKGFAALVQKPCEILALALALALPLANHVSQGYALPARGDCSHDPTSRHTPFSTVPASSYREVLLGSFTAALVHVSSERYRRD